MFKVKAPFKGIVYPDGTVFLYARQGTNEGHPVYECIFIGDALYVDEKGSLQRKRVSA